MCAIKTLHKVVIGHDGGGAVVLCFSGVFPEKERRKIGNGVTGPRPAEGQRTGNCFTGMAKNNVVFIRAHKNIEPVPEKGEVSVKIERKLNF